MLIHTWLIIIHINITIPCDNLHSINFQLPYLIPLSTTKVPYFELVEVWLDFLVHLIVPYKRLFAFTLSKSNKLAQSHSWIISIVITSVLVAQYFRTPFCNPCYGRSNFLTMVYTFCAPTQVCVYRYKRLMLSSSDETYLGEKHHSWKWFFEHVFLCFYLSQSSYPIKYKLGWMIN